MAIDLDGLPYVPAANQRRRGATIDLIVLHSGETNEGSTAAEGMANYFASGNTIGSAHICVDDDSAVRCAPDENRTNGAGGVNENGLHLEQAGRAGQLRDEWLDPYSSSVVAHSADVVAGWIRRHPQLRPVFLDATALAAGERNGITTHAEVSKVFAGNDGHWDPGPEYPIDVLLAQVVDRLNPAPAVPAPAPPRFALTGDDSTMGFAAAVTPGKVWETITITPAGQVVQRYYPRTVPDEASVIATGAKPGGDVKIIRQTTPTGDVGRGDVWFEKPDGTLGHVFQQGAGDWAWHLDTLTW